MPSQSFQRLYWVFVVALVGLCDQASSADDKPAATLSDPVTWIGNSQFVLRCELGRVWKGPEAAQLKKLSETHPMVLLSDAADLDKAIGIRLADIDRVVIFADELAKLDESSIFIETRAPFDRDKVIDAIVPNGKEVKVKDRAYIAGERDKKAVYLQTNRSLVIRNRTAMESLLNGMAGEPGALKEALSAGPNTLLTLGFQPGTFLPAVRMAGKQSEIFVPLFQARTWQATVDGGDELSLSFRFTFPDEATAKEAIPSLKALVAPLDGYLELAETELPKALKRDVGKYPSALDLQKPLVESIQALRASLKEFRPEQNGRVVHAKLRVKTQTPATTLVMIASLMPRASKAP